MLALCCEVCLMLNMPDGWPVLYVMMFQDRTRLAIVVLFRLQSLTVPCAAVVVEGCKMSCVLCIS